MCNENLRFEDFQGLDVPFLKELQNISIFDNSLINKIATDIDFEMVTLNTNPVFLTIENSTEKLQYCKETLTTYYFITLRKASLDALKEGFGKFDWSRVEGYPMSSTLLTIFANEHCSSFENLEQLLKVTSSGTFDFLDVARMETFFEFFLTTLRTITSSDRGNFPQIEAVDFHSWVTGRYPYYYIRELF
jgi:hypothetical protein